MAFNFKKITKDGVKAKITPIIPVKKEEQEIPPHPGQQPLKPWFYEKDFIEKRQELCRLSGSGQRRSLLAFLAALPQDIPLDELTIEVLNDFGLHTLFSNPTVCISKITKEPNPGYAERKAQHERALADYQKQLDAWTIASEKYNTYLRANGKQPNPTFVEWAPTYTFAEDYGFATNYHTIRTNYD